MTRSGRADTTPPVHIDGVFPPIPTPFKDGQVDVTAMASNVERWMATRIRGVVVLGSNGEAPLIDEAESDAAIAAARSAVPSDRLCLAGTGRESTAAALTAGQRIDRRRPHRRAAKEVPRTVS